MRYILLFISIFIFSVGEGYSLTYVDAFEGMGDVLLAVDAASLGRGQTSIASSWGAAALYSNPANILKLRQPELLLSASVFPIKEQIEDSTDWIYYNSQYYYSLSNVSFAFPVKRYLAFSIGQRPIYDFNYAIERSAYVMGTKTEYYSEDAKGALSSTALALALHISEPLSFGLTYHIAGGGLDQEFIDYDTNSSRIVYDMDGDFSGNFYNLGLNYNIKDGVDLSFIWRPSFDIVLDKNSQTDLYSWSVPIGDWALSSSSVLDRKEKFKYPEQYGIGINYEFWEKDRAVLSVDLIKTRWSRFSYKVAASGAGYGVSTDPDYVDTTNLCVGISHYLKRTMILRYGFSHIPGYVDSSLDASLVTAGLGMEISEKLNLDIGASYGQRTHIGSIPSFSETTLEVNERIAQIGASLCWRFIKKQKTEIEEEVFDESMEESSGGVLTEDIVMSGHFEIQSDPAGTKLLIKSSDIFENGKTTLKSDAKAILDSVAVLIKQNRNKSIYIDVYTDSLGAIGYKKELSSNQAEAIYSYLLKKRIPKKQLSWKGYGSANPIASNDTEEGRIKNNRIEIFMRNE